MTLSGIYKIQSKVKPDRIYIGSAVHLSKRWTTHLWGLRNNKHHSIKLQRHFNKYGESDLQFSILLSCDNDDLIRIEQYFIDSYNPYFNECQIAGSSYGRKATPETKEKMRKRKGEKRQPMPEERKKKIGRTRKKRNIKPWNYHKKGVYSKECIERISAKNRVPILQFDLLGIFIKEWDSAKTAGDILLISSGNITQVARGKKKSANGFNFKYK